MLPEKGKLNKAEKARENHPSQAAAKPKAHHGGDEVHIGDTANLHQTLALLDAGEDVQLIIAGRIELAPAPAEPTGPLL